MKLGDIALAAVYLSMLAAVYVFIFRGRSLGYKGLAARTAELSQQGIQTVYLLSSLNDVGLGARPGSMWSLLNTGYLGYVKDGAFVAEFPWWHKVRELFSVLPAKAEVRFTANAATIWKKWPGIQIDGWNFVVVGVNITDVTGAKQAIKRTGLTPQQVADYRAQLAAELSQAGFIVNGVGTG